MATIAPFPASKLTHCALVVCDSEWMTVAVITQRLFLLLLLLFVCCCSCFGEGEQPTQRSGVLTELLGCYVAGATWNCCRFGACSVYTMKLCTSLQYKFIRNHIRIVVCGHGLVTLSLTSNETLKWLSSLPTLMQQSFWWWQCSDRYILSLSPPSPYPFPSILPVPNKPYGFCGR